MPNASPNLARSRSQLKSITIGALDPQDNVVETFILPVSHLSQSSLLWKPRERGIVFIPPDTEFCMTASIAHLAQVNKPLGSPLMGRLKAGGYRTIGISAKLGLTCNAEGVTSAQAGDVKYAFLLDNLYRPQRHHKVTDSDTYDLLRNLCITYFEVTLAPIKSREKPKAAQENEVEITV